MQHLSQRFVFVWFSLHSFRGASWFQSSASVFMSEYYIKFYQVYPDIDGKKRPDLNNLRCSLLFLLLTDLDTLITEALCGATTTYCGRYFTSMEQQKWPLLPKYWARETQNLKSPLGIQRATKYYWLSLLLMYWQSFCKGVMVRKSFIKEEFEGDCRDVMVLVYRKGQWNPMRISTVESTKWLKISQADDAG